MVDITLCKYEDKKYQDFVFCLFVLSGGSRRSSDDPEDFEAADEKMTTMTEEQREYLQWYYRTEDCKWYWSKPKCTEIVAFISDYSKCCCKISSTAKRC